MPHTESHREDMNSIGESGVSLEGVRVIVVTMHTVDESLGEEEDIPCHLTFRAEKGQLDHDTGLRT